MVPSILERFFGPKRALDPVLGELEYVTGHGWSGRTAAGVVFGLLSSRRGGVDPRLRDVLADALAEAKALEGVSRAYLRRDVRTSDIELGALLAVEVGYAEGKWIELALARDGEGTEVEVREGDILTTFMFEIFEDRNVVEVILKGHHPITSDYH